MKSLVPAPGYLFCDIVPHVLMKDALIDGATRKVNDLEALQPWRDVGTIILDHHKGVQDVIQSFGDLACFGDEKTEPGVCGAVLAYRHVWRVMKSGQPDDVFTRQSVQIAEDFATLAGIVDTWVRDHPRWSEARIQASMLGFYPAEHWLSIPSPFKSFGTAPSMWEERRSIGRLLMDRNDRTVKKAVEGSHKFTSPKGTRVVTFNNLKAASDAAELLGSEADLIVGFSYIVEGGVPKMLFSTRSHTTFDCLAFAKSNGGGGHTRAAGFTIPVSPNDSNPYNRVPELVERYESTQ